MSTASRRRIEVAGAVAVAGALVLSAGWNVARDRARSEPRVIIATVADAATASSGVDPVVTWRRGAEAVIADRLADELAAREAELAATVPSGMCVAIRVANLPLLRLGDPAPEIGRAQSLVVLAAAVEELGTAHRFTTEIVAPAPIDGVIDGDVWLIGGGDPLLGSERVTALMGADGVVRPTRADALAAALAAAGIAEITGDIIGDGRYFDGERRPAEWPDTVPLSEAGRIAGLTIDSGRIWVDPRNVAFDPVQAAARTLIDMLAVRDVVVRGAATTAGRAAAPPPDATRIAQVGSVPLATATAAWTAESVLPSADVAETLLRHLGVGRSGEGSRVAGAAAVREMTAGWGVEPAGLIDGSGIASGSGVGCDTLLVAHERLSAAVGGVPAQISNVVGVIDSRGIGDDGAEYRVLAAGIVPSPDDLATVHAAAVELVTTAPELPPLSLAMPRDGEPS